MQGYLSLVLHAHLPFVRHPEHERFLEEDWLFEAITETYDFVVCSNVLDHTGDWLEFAELLASRVGPAGQLLLMTDTRDAPVMGHTQIFSPSQLVRVFKLLGLKNIYFENINKIDNSPHHNPIHVRARQWLTSFVKKPKRVNQIENQVFLRAGR